MRLAACALLATLLAGCRVGVEPLPMTGAVPETIAVWPTVLGAEPADDEVWFAGLCYALGRRGYRVVAPGVARELLRTSDLASPLVGGAAVGRALMADAVLHFEVRAFDAEADGALQSARWDVTWRLQSTRGYGEQWGYQSVGSWRQADRDPLDSSRGLDEMQDPPPIVPIGGSRVPGFRDVRELMAHLHRDAMGHLPERSR